MALEDFHWIVPDLAQGSYPDPVKDSFDVFDVVVLCAEELQSPRTKAPSGKHIFRVPLDDDIYRPLPEDVGDVLHEVAKRLATYCAGGNKVLVTCAQGWNRSGIVNALVLMYGYQMPPKKAIDLIRKKRSSDALCNPMFEQYILTTTLR